MYSIFKSEVSTVWPMNLLDLVRGPSGTALQVAAAAY